MPSPFPGMDPYLEHPALWPDVHGRWINVASELLLAQLRPRYFVQIDERLYLANDNDPARYLKLVDRESNNVITVIEVLSPANKIKNSVAKRDYDAKRADVLSGGTHFVEIDLLREGEPIVSPELARLREYAAQVWRFPKGELKPTRWAWPMSIHEPLKAIPIPVRPEDPDAVLDLQQTLDIAYERAGYELRVNYRRPPRPPLQGELAEWAQQICSNASGTDREK